MPSVLVGNRFARDARGQLFDLATGRDVSTAPPEHSPAPVPEAALEELVRTTGDVLEAAGSRVHAIGFGALSAGHDPAAREACVAAEAARRGFAPVSLAGLRRLPAPGCLRRRSALVIAGESSSCHGEALVEGVAVLLVLSALGARPAAVLTAAGPDHGAVRAGRPGDDGLLAEGVPATGYTGAWRVAECASRFSGRPPGTSLARSQRALQAQWGAHRRRHEVLAFLEASLALAQLHLERDAPEEAARVARDARAWRPWWGSQWVSSTYALSRVLSLLDIEAGARLSSGDFDGQRCADDLHAGLFGARAVGLSEFDQSLSTHLATIERRAGRPDAARRALVAAASRSSMPQGVLCWNRERLHTGLSCGHWEEVGDAAQALRRLSAGATPAAVTALAALEVATFHLRIGDVATARSVLGEHGAAFAALRGADRVRHACVRRAAGLGPATHDGAGPWRALARDYAALTRPRRSADVGGVRPPDGAGLNARGVRRGRGTGESVMEDVLDLLRACHEAEDDQRGLGRMCSLVRERLGALAVGVWASPHLEPLAGAGSGRHWPTSLAERARTTGLPHGPEANGAAQEAAWPVTHGGTPIGALACRWLIDQPIDRPRMEIMLTAAAAACVPLVRGTIDAKEQARSAPGEPELGLVGDSDAVRQLRAGIRRAALAPFHVLIEGESGSGKELVARAIHTLSPRRLKRFCAVNCAALTDDLLEAELFGHTRGAFTGALTERAGLFEDASGGTLFLDEVADLSPRGQAKVLRVLQDGEVRRVGENFSRRVDVRIVAATNKPLRDEVALGHFRQDLRYRLDVLRLTIPPLRERRGDVALLAMHFWRDAAVRVGSRAVLDGAVLAALSRHDWPGNVRELQNVMAAVAVHAPARGRVGLAALPPAVRAPDDEAAGATLVEARRRFEAEYVQRALAKAGGCRAQAARSLGVTRQGLAKLVDRLGLDPGTFNSL